MPPLITGVLNRLLPARPYYGNNFSRSISRSRPFLDSSSFLPLFGHGRDVAKKEEVSVHARHRFTLSTFNILAPCYKRIAIRGSNGRRLRESVSEDLWSTRASHLFNFLETYIFPYSSVIALQEYWLDEKYTAQFKEFYSKFGFELSYLQRTGLKADALAFLVRTSEWDTLGRENVTLCEQGDRVGLIVWLRHRLTGRDVIVANTHLSFPHSPLDRTAQMEQMKRLTGVIDRFGVDNNIESVPKLVVGDFNVESNSPVCSHLRMKGFNSSFDVIPPYYSSSTMASLSDRLNHHDFESKLYPSIGQNSEFAKFISHRTHRNEDLGVDHIFVSSDLHPLSVGINNDNSVSINNNSNNNNNSDKNKSNNNNSNNNSTSSSDNNNNNSINNPLITVSTQVDPAALPFHIWDERFNIISDHRPVSATFEFT